MVGVNCKHAIEALVSSCLAIILGLSCFMGDLTTNKPRRQSNYYGKCLLLKVLVIIVHDRVYRQ